MGWGCSAPGKRDMIFPASVRVPVTHAHVDILQNASSVVVDVNAIFRHMLAPNGGCTMTPVVATYVFFKQYILTCPNAKVVVFCFDSPSLVPLERGVFHRTVRYQKADRAPTAGEVIASDGRLYKEEFRPIEDDQIKFLTADHIPGGVWERFWNSPKGKYKMWETIADCLKDIIQRPGTPNKTYIIDMQDGSRYYEPAAFAGLDTNVGANWGEADAKALQYSLFLKKEYAPVVISTIDWDMALQVLVHDTSDIFVRIGNVFQTDDKEHIFYSSGSATRAYKKDPAIGKPVRCFEFIDCSLLMQKFPSRAHRLEATFWCLAAGGVDYCTGLASFGFGEKKCKEMLIMCGNVDHKPFIKEGYESEGNPLRRHVKINMTLLMRRMRDAPPGKVRTQDIATFNTELQRMFFCLLYFIGFDPTRDRAGPLLDTQFILGSCKSVHEFYSGLHFVEDVEYEEQFPDTALRCNPLYTYSTTAAQQIKTVW